MNLPVHLLTVAHLITVAACVERRLLEVRSGRRTCRLFCRVGIGFHLQIHSDGRVNGSHEPNLLSVLELIAFSPGVIAIRGVHSNKFLSMNRRGRLQATGRFSDDCKFRERFQENGYNTYASVLHQNQRTGREWFLALNKRGKAKMGSSPRVKPQHVSTHFLPRLANRDELQRGFAVADQRRDRPRVEVRVSSPPKRTVKYWPKYRFG
ncbi:fibroblast growth factor 5 [Synchiropus splendidus]|uniref:fibroblast growth factor 5 n=1 Tax=Synchiropus splendidus TaxID=270530 RepID=UPI00237E32C0|nr:fibroblast growth factor 5 [Synchiropus splendidus]